MERVKYITSIMSRTQKEAYAKIKELKYYSAVGPMIKTCRVLMQLGLIMPNPNGKRPNEYVLNGKALDIPVTGKLPQKKDFIKVILEKSIKPVKKSISMPTVAPENFTPKHVPIMEPAKPLIRAAAIYDNPRREEHVEKWIKEEVTPDPLTFVPVKCLKEWQMKYVLHNYEEHTAQQMAEKLKVDTMYVKLFCQANAIAPLSHKQSKRKIEAA